jgi:hypothetical protein
MIDKWIDEIGDLGSDLISVGLGAFIGYWYIAGDRDARHLLSHAPLLIVALVLGKVCWRVLRRVTTGRWTRAEDRL